MPGYPNTDTLCVHKESREVRVDRDSQRNGHCEKNDFLSECGKRLENEVTRTKARSASLNRRNRRLRGPSGRVEAWTDDGRRERIDTLLSNKLKDARVKRRTALSNKFHRTKNETATLNEFGAGYGEAERFVSEIYVKNLKRRLENDKRVIANLDELFIRHSDRNSSDSSFYSESPSEINKKSGATLTIKNFSSTSESSLTSDCVSIERKDGAFNLKRISSKNIRQGGPDSWLESSSRFSDCEDNQRSESCDKSNESIEERAKHVSITRVPRLILNDVEIERRDKMADIACSTDAFKTREIENSENCATHWKAKSVDLFVGGKSRRWDFVKSRCWTADEKELAVKVTSNLNSRESAKSTSSEQLPSSKLRSNDSKIDRVEERSDCNSSIGSTLPCSSCEQFSNARTSHDSDSSGSFDGANRAHRDRSSVSSNAKLINIQSKCAFHDDGIGSNVRGGGTFRDENSSFESRSEDSDDTRFGKMKRDCEKKEFDNRRNPELEQLDESESSGDRLHNHGYIARLAATGFEETVAQILNSVPSVQKRSNPRTIMFKLRKFLRKFRSSDSRLDIDEINDSTEIIYVNDKYRCASARSNGPSPREDRSSISARSDILENVRQARSESDRHVGNFARDSGVSIGKSLRKAEGREHVAIESIGSEDIYRGESRSRLNPPIGDSTSEEKRTDEYTRRKLSSESRDDTVGPVESVGVPSTVDGPSVGHPIAGNVGRSNREFRCCPFLCLRATGSGLDYQRSVTERGTRSERANR